MSAKSGPKGKSEEVRKKPARAPARSGGKGAHLPARLSEQLIISSIDGILAFDLECRYTLWNPAMEKISGINREQAIGRCAFDLFPFLKESGEDYYFYEALHGRSLISTERPYTVPESGREGYFEGHYSPLHDETGAIIGALAIIRDVTERRRAADESVRLEREEATRSAVQTSEKNLAFLADLSKSLNSSLDVDLTLERVSRLTLPVLGDMCIIDVLDEDSSVKRVAVSHLLPEKLSMLEELKRLYPPSWESPQPQGRVLRSGKPELLERVSEDVIKRHTRSQHHFDLIRAIGIRSHLAVPLSVHGEIRGVISFGTTESDRRYSPTDLRLAEEVSQRAAYAIEHARLYKDAQDEIAERMRVESALRASEQRFARFMQYLPGLAWIKDTSGRYIYVNEAAQNAFGKRREEILGRTDTALFPPVTAAQFQDNDRRALSGGEGIQTIEYLEHTDGQTHASVVNKFPIPDADGKVTAVGGVAFDITKLLTTEAALRESEIRFRQLVENIDDVFWVFDPVADRLLYLSDAYERVWGRTCQSALVRPKSMLEAVHPEDRARASTALSAQAEGKLTNETYRIIRPDSEVRWIWDRGYPVRDSAGAVYRVCGIAEDVTERRAIEEKLRQRADDLALVDNRKDAFLAILSHELRNPLAPLKNAVEILKRSEQNGSRLSDLRDTMERQVSTLTRLTDELLDISRVNRGKILLKKELIDPCTALKNSVETSMPLIEKLGHTLSIDLPADDIRLNADRVRFEQIVTNLLNNAAKYTPDGGALRLSAKREGQQLVVTVADNGIGFRPDALSKIFEPFQQGERVTERSQEGLGIGLALVKGLVELHGGTISARSAGTGRGSEFELRLPLASDAERGETPSAPRSARIQTHEHTGARILIVDDNREAARTLGLLLQMEGYEVRCIYDGETGVAIAGDFTPHAVLLDLGMPYPDGYEVARRIRNLENCSSTLLIAMTGYGRSDDFRRTKEAGFDAHLVKPVSVRAIVDVLSRSKLSDDSTAAPKTIA